MTINWFPGHMVKARQEIKENLKLIDIVIEIVDARAPESSRNRELEELCQRKPILMVLNKRDLVEKKDLDKWLNRLHNEGHAAVAINAVTGEGLASMLKGVEKLYQPVVEAMLEKNRRRRPPRVMIVGIPNVGKSTFLNAINKKKVVRTGPMPGVTRGKQWVRIEGRIDLLDTPGLMWPRIEKPEQGLKLAALGCLGDKAYSNSQVAFFIIDCLKRKSPGALEKAYGVEEQNEPGIFLESIVLGPGNIDEGLDRKALILITGFRKGQLAKITLDD
ncbi:MAG: ribosome biogenesis GTPase YlqF [Chitinophagales bacterium]